MPIMQQLFAPNREVDDNSAASTAFVNASIPVNIKRFGAKADGGDDYPAFAAAFASAPSGRLYVPPGTYNTISGSIAPPSNWTLEGAGIDATILKNNVPTFDGDATINILMTMTGSHVAGWDVTNTTYPLNAPTLGDNKVTTTTAANAGNFAPGNIVLISGGLHSTSFWYPAWFTTVQSVNAGTGVITLAESLPFGGSQITTVQKILSLPKNITVRDMTVSAGLGGALQANGGQNILIENVRFIPGSSGPSGSGPVLSVQKNSMFRACRAEQGCAPIELFAAFQSYIEGCHLYNSAILADGGCIDCGIINNYVKDPMINGVGFNGIYVPDYGARNRIIGNTVVGVADGFAGILTTNIPDVNRGNAHIGNTIVGLDTVNTVGIVCQGDIVVGNRLVNLTTGISPDANANVFVSGNTFDTVTNHLSNPGGNPPWRSQATLGLVKTMASGTATPNVAGAGFYQLTNASPQTITNFLNGEIGDEIVITFNDGNTTIQGGVNIATNANVSYNPPAGATMTFRMSAAGPFWTEVSRSSLYPTFLSSVTQATSKSTGVTLNANAGAITMNNAALLAGAMVGFTLNNSTIGGADVIDVSIAATGSTAGAYTVQVDSVQNGSCKIWLTNRSGGSLSEAVVLNFAVIKWVNR